jgi:hypothetical protein
MGRLNDSIEKLKKIVDENESKAFTPTQKMQVRYASNDLAEVQKKLGG